MIWNPEKECLRRQEYRDIQLERLKWTVKRAYEKVPFYRRRFDEIGLKPEHIQTLKDIEKIPYTTKLDLRENYPFQLFAEPMERIVRLHASSGTTGKPVVFGYTKNDMDIWKENISRIAAQAGVTSGCGTDRIRFRDVYRRLRSVSGTGKYGRHSGACVFRQF